MEERYQQFAEAARAYAELVRAISGGWDQPGLGEWTVRDLVGHTSRSLITVETYLGQPADAEDIPSPVEYYRRVAQVDHAAVAERGREAGRALGPEPVTFVDQLVDRVLPLLPAAGDPVITTILGGMRLSRYLPTRTFELVVHGLDISAATGLPVPDYSPDTLNEVIGIAGAVAVATGQGPHVLRALTGRAPLPAGFSVV